MSEMIELSSECAAGLSPGDVLHALASSEQGGMRDAGRAFGMGTEMKSRGGGDD